MKNKKIFWSLGIVTFLIVLVMSINAALNFSDSKREANSLETLSSTEGKDSHFAVGENILDKPFVGIRNDDETLEYIVRNNEVTVVNFFASWCGPCRNEMPELMEYNEKSEDDINIVAINLNDTTNSRDDFLNEFNVSLPVYEFTDEEDALEHYRVQLMPTTFFVNRDGEIVRAYIGEVSQELVQNYVNYVKERS